MVRPAIQSRHEQRQAAALTLRILIVAGGTSRITTLQATTVQTPTRHGPLNTSSDRTNPTDPGIHNPPSRACDDPADQRIRPHSGARGYNLASPSQQTPTAAKQPSLNGTSCPDSASSAPASTSTAGGSSASPPKSSITLMEKTLEPSRSVGSAAAATEEGAKPKMASVGRFDTR